MSLREQLDQETCVVSDSKLGVITCSMGPTRCPQPVFSVSWYIPKLGGEEGERVRIGNGQELYGGHQSARAAH